MIECVIINAKIVSPREILHGCIAIDGGKIELVGPRFLMPQSRQTIDARDRFVIPGLIDPHIHYGLFGTESIIERVRRDWAPDSVGAVYGGVTTVLPMLMSTDSYVPLVKDLTAWAELAQPTDFGFTVIVHQDQHQRDMPELFEMGVTSYKHFFNAFKGNEGYRINVAPVDEGMLFRSFEIARDLGEPALCMVHAEDCDLYNVFIAKERTKGRDGLEAWADARPQFTEYARIEFAATLAYEAAAPLYFVHLSTRQSVGIVQKYKLKGARLSAEVVPHTLTVSRHDREVGVWGKFVPPLRGWEDINHLWDGLRSGVIDHMATDHCTYLVTEKEAGQGKHGSIWDVPPGISNVQEHWLPVIMTDGVRLGKISIQDLVRVCSENTAKRFGLYPRKGVIAMGADADLVIVDDGTEVLVDQDFYHGRDGSFSIHMGKRVIGRPVLTMVRGQVLMQEGKYLGTRGGGRFTPSRRA